nr:hypothetical protein [Tanacetum cinerariifolium]
HGQGRSAVAAGGAFPRDGQRVRGNQQLVEARVAGGVVADGQRVRAHAERNVAQSYPLPASRRVRVHFLHAHVVDVPGPQIVGAGAVDGKRHRQEGRGRGGGGIRAAQAGLQLHIRAAGSGRIGHHTPIRAHRGALGFQPDALAQGLGRQRRQHGVAGAPPLVPALVVQGRVRVHGDVGIDAGIAQ